MSAPERPWTADRKNWITGTTRMTVKRVCNGCGRELGDATSGELLAAVLGDDLPDVRDECGCAAWPLGDACAWCEFMPAIGWAIGPSGDQEYPSCGGPECGPSFSDTPHFPARVS